MSNNARPAKDQRSEERYDCVGTVLLYAPIDFENESGSAQDFHQALMQDMSLGGLSFEVSNSIPVGNLLLLIVRPAHGSGEEHLTTEVRWCKQIAPDRYRIGVRIEVSEFHSADPVGDGEIAESDPAGSIVGVLTSYRQALAAGDDK